MRALMGPLASITAALLIVCALPAAADQGNGAFIRGDSNTDGIVDIADPLFNLNYSFYDGPSPCKDAMDSNDDGVIDVADVVFQLSYLFTSGAEPPAPFGWCGYDPTSDTLACDKNLTCDIGGPIEGLTVEQLRSYNAGREVMTRRFTQSEGVGPFLNSVSCDACHTNPAPGGSSPLYRNFILMAVGLPGEQTKVSYLPSMVLTNYNLTDHRLDNPRPLIQASTPEDPVTLAGRNAPPMFGTGLFEFVSNAEITSHADPSDLITPDGISGRFNTSEGAIGRFGYKLQANFIEPFIRGASFNQMGITTVPVEGSDGQVSLSCMKQIMSSLDDPTVDDDGVDDPEMTFDELADLITFCRFIAPIEPRPFGADEAAGEGIFASIGCDKCHLPTIQSDYGELPAYTDLLLHDIGTGDGLAQGLPQFSMIASDYNDQEFRTQPLWGVSFHPPFLHDGSADTFHDAILRHSGEAEGIKQAYENLTPEEQQKLIKFLEAI